MSEEKPSSSAAAGPANAVDLSKYTLTQPLEIAHHLKGIALSGHMVTVFSNKGRTFILTRLLDVDAKSGTMMLDWGANPETNQQLLTSERNVFVCSPDGVKTQFVTGPVRRVDYQGQPAFEVGLPEQVIKLQRREFFRIQTPVAQPVLCRIGDYPGHIMELALFDISLGGVSMWLPAVHTPGFDIGQQFHDCAIDLAPFGHLQVGLEIRHHLEVRLKNGLEMVRIGSVYLGMNTARENLVQRYVAHLERERRALVR